MSNGTVVAISPDGLSAAVGGQDGELEVIDLATGEPVHPAVSGVRGDIISVAFSPDGIPGPDHVHRTRRRGLGRAAPVSCCPGSRFRWEIR